MKPTAIKIVLDPTKPGFVEARTGRVAVLVKDYAANPPNGDVAAYWYSPDAEDLGLDPWRLVEGVDPHTDGQGFDVWFASGTSRTVGPLATLFLSAADAARLAA